MSSMTPNEAYLRTENAHLRRLLHAARNYLAGVDIDKGLRIKMSGQPEFDRHLASLYELWADGYFYISHADADQTETRLLAFLRGDFGARPAASETYDPASTKPVLPPEIELFERISLFLLHGESKPLPARPYTARELEALLVSARQGEDGKRWFDLGVSIDFSDVASYLPDTWEAIISTTLFGALAYIDIVELEVVGHGKRTDPAQGTLEVLHLSISGWVTVF